MKLIKPLLFVLTGLAALLTLISLLMPSRMMISRSVGIHQPMDSVQPFISHLTAWQSWYQPLREAKDARFEPSDHPQKVSWTYNGKPQTLIMEKDSAHVWQGRLEREGERPVPYIIRLSESAEPSSVNVDWRIVVDLGWYPWDKFSGMMLDKMTGPGYEAALQQLKAVAEQKH